MAEFMRIEDLAALPLRVTVWLLCIGCVVVMFPIIVYVRGYDAADESIGAAPVGG